MVDVRDLERAISVTRRLLAQLIEKLLHLIGRAASLPFFELLIVRTTIDIMTEAAITGHQQATAFTFLVEFGPDGKARRLAGALIFFGDVFFHQLACPFRQSVGAIA